MLNAARQTVFLVDDSVIVRERLASLISELPNVEIIGQAEFPSQAVFRIRDLKPAVVVLDISMPGMSGLEAAPHILKLRAGCRILIFTMHDSAQLVSEIRDVGAQGYVQKSQAARDLVEAIECLLKGGTFFGDGCKGVTALENA